MSPTAYAFWTAFLIVAVLGVAMLMLHPLSFWSMLLGVCLGLAGALIAVPSAGWPDLRERLQGEPP